MPSLSALPPGGLLILGGLLLPILPGRWRSGWMLALPILSGLQLLAVRQAFPEGGTWTFALLDYQLVPVQVDRLSLVWGVIFHMAALLCAVYALPIKDAVQQVTALVYAGAALGAVFAGDLLTLFVYWELTAISSVFLIWARRTERSYRAGMRYLIIQVGSGVILLAGILLHLRDTGSLAFREAFYHALPATDATWWGLNSPGTALIFLAFGIKAAFPLLHNWLADAYPEATVPGTVYLSIFTTKLAIYTLARGFPGTGILVGIGATMTVFPLFYALLENDLRRAMTYILNNQLGFMVVGIGLANFARSPEVAQLALNGTAAHAFAHILYEGLLFMALGAVLYRRGTIHSSQLGRLYPSMPWTAACCLVGAASISGFPLLSGFVTKSMIVTAAAEQHRTVVWLVLLFASVGVFLVAGIKIPRAAFFGRGPGPQVSEAPPPMLAAMIGGAALCLILGIWPGGLYALLPYPVTYQPYTVSHVIVQLQLLAFTGLAYAGLRRAALFPVAQPSVNLDTDWFYRRLLPAVVARLVGEIRQLGSAVAAGVRQVLQAFLAWVRQQCDPGGVFGRSWSTGGMVIWAAMLLGAYLILYYLER
ncbi:MAG: Na(+)/H(+) antiporter subunit D [Planctomycetales bacterium]|nr:Na(+)/H(+) antiporter subunit D [Planctomycetales bacterium]